ncbi:MAG: hypothetical protein ACYTG4_11925 [Planctomycetota bacterium]|jgi:hypothetical protein
MSTTKRLLVLAAMAGIVGGGLAGCASNKSDKATTEKNACSGKNGCSGDKNKCSGDKNSCKEGSGCGKNACG